MKAEDQNKRSTRTKETGMSSSKSSMPYIFRPTEAEKRTIREEWLDAVKNLSIIEEPLNEGCKLILGYAPSTGAMYATIRANKPDIPWDEQHAVTAWHSDASMCLAMLAYYLREVNQGFPAVIQTSFSEKDWNW